MAYVIYAPIPGYAESKAGYAFGNDLDPDETTCVLEQVWAIREGLA